MKKHIDFYTQMILGGGSDSGGGGGTPGQAATIQVGSTTTGEPGTQAQVTNSGTANAAVFDFVIPRGADGADGGAPGADGAPGQAATIQVGQVTTGEPGTPASVTNVGTENAAVFDFVIPKGADGADGEDGAPGADGADGAPGQAATIQVGQVTTGEPGTPASVTNVGTENAAIFDFVIPKGEPGESGGGSISGGDDLARYAFSLPDEIDCSMFQFASDLSGVTYHTKTGITIVGDSSDEKAHVWLPKFETHKPLNSTDYTKFNFLIPVAITYGVTTAYVLIPASGYWDFTSATPKMNVQTAPTFFNATRQEGSDFNLLSEFYITVTPEEVSQ